MKTRRREIKEEEKVLLLPGEGKRRILFACKKGRPLNFEGKERSISLNNKKEKRREGLRGVTSVAIRRGRSCQGSAPRYEKNVVAEKRKRERKGLLRRRMNGKKARTAFKKETRIA